MIPKKVEQRIKDGIRKYSSILQGAKSRDINESDTVTIVSDMLAEVFGYDKYIEITKEYMVKGTFCDLAIKQGSEPVYLIECKAIGVNLKEAHMRQAIEYSAAKGNEWAILTNGQIWKMYKITYSQPLKTEEVFELDFLGGKTKDEEFINKAFLLSKEAINRSDVESYYEQGKLVNKYMVAAALMSEEVAGVIRKMLRIVSDKAKVDAEAITRILHDEVIKREIVESDETREADKRIKKQMKKHASAKEGKKEAAGPAPSQQEAQGDPEGQQAQ